MLSACIYNRKKIRERYLLHGGNAGDLQNLPKGVRQVEPALGDGHEQIGTDRRPDFHPHAVERTAEKPRRRRCCLIQRKNNSMAQRRR